MCTLHQQVERLATNEFLVDAVEASLGTEEELKVYLLLDDLWKMEEMII